MYLVLCTMVLFFIKAPYKPSYSRLESMWPVTACTKFLIGYRLLVDSGLLKKDRIPDISKISKFLESKTGFRLRPASGLCPAREFLACLGFVSLAELLSLSNS